MARAKKASQESINQDELELVNGNLTLRQEKFCLEYVVRMNGTEAARQAGYSGNDNVLAVTAHDNLRNPKIRARVNELLASYTMEKNEILSRLTVMARGDIADLLDPKTMSIDWQRAKALGVTHLVKKFKQTVITKDDSETLITEVELHDPQAALVHLGKAHALFTDKVRTEDWRTDAIDALARGVMTYEELLETFPDEPSLAEELFNEAKKITLGRS